MTLSPVPEPLARQIAAGRVALALADAEAGDMQLVLINEAFSRITGYDEASVLGRNCRFLQGIDTEPWQPRRMAEFLADDGRHDGRFGIVNYRQNGERFENLVFMSKLRREGRVRFVLASQFDMTRAVAAEQLARNDQLLSEEVADLRDAAAGFGLTMQTSSELIARSISTLARMALSHERDR